MTPTGPQAHPRYPDRAEPAEAAAGSLHASWRDYLPTRALQLRKLITDQPGESWERDPELLVAVASTYRTASSLNLYAASSYLDAADALIGGDERLRALSALQRSEAMRGLGRLAESLQLARGVIDTIAATSLPLLERLALEAHARIAAGISLALLGDLATAEESIRHGLGLADPKQAAGEAAIEGLGWLAILAWYTGTATGPQQHIEHAHALGDEPGLIDDLAGVPTHIAEALIAFDRAEFEAAVATLEPTTGITVGTEYHIFRLHALSIARGGLDDGLDEMECLQEARVLLQSWPSPSLYHLQHETVLTVAQLQAGALSSARESISALARLLEEVPDPNHAYCTGRLEARLAMHAGDYEAVLERTQPCRAIGDEHALRTRACVDVLRAAARLQLGDASLAAQSIDHALVQAARTSWRRPLLILPAPILRLVLDSASSRPQPDAVTALIEQVASHLPDDAAEGHIEPLSERERIILAHLAEGRSRQEISALLHVSPNTVKSQTRSLYHKLGASSKHEAIERAARYGIHT